MEPQQRTKTTWRTLPFAFADGVLSFYAEGAKAYWRSFGPLGQPAVRSVEAWEGWQRRCLEALEATLGLPTTAPMGSERTPPPPPPRRTAARPFPLSPLSFLGFDD